MSELKFRAWVYYGEKLEKPHYSRDYGSLDRFFEDHSENDIDQCIEQYTGLKDENGEEIYEGDICRCSFGECGVVNYRHGEFCIVGDDIVGMSLWKEKAFDIIGNVHENPELLEEEEK